LSKCADRFSLKLLTVIVPPFGRSYVPINRISLE
jgi:hypothetical protein